MLTLNRQQLLERENALAQHNRKYYEAMEQQQFEIRRIRHDLANHLQVLLSLPAEEKDSYIRKMIENPALEKVLSYSGDATVIAVLTAKESVMRQRGIASQGTAFRKTGSLRAVCQCARQCDRGVRGARFGR